MGIVLIILVIVALIAVWVIKVYNGLVKARQKVKNSWSQIEVQLQRRFDLIPNLVEAVKGYMGHESDVLEKVTSLRTSWANTSDVSEKVKIDNELSGALKTIMAVSENYPDLKANQNFTDLQNNLKETENKISFSRQFYNDSVTIYNTRLETFPSNLIASMFGFKAEALFNVDNEAARQNVKVDFNK